MGFITFEDNYYIIYSEDYETISFKTLKEVESCLFFIHSEHPKYHFIINEDCYTKEFKKVMKKYDYHTSVVADSAFKKLLAII